MSLTYGGRPPTITRRQRLCTRPHSPRASRSADGPTAPLASPVASPREHLLARRSAAAPRLNLAGASRTLRQALDLWTGPPFADVHTGAHLAMEARRLEESRLCALDQRIEADLRLGRHRELLAELTVLTSRYRTHENLHAQFTLALYRSGRRGEALHVYRQLRTLLVRDLGLEPSARLRRLQQSILTATAETPGPPTHHDELAAPVPSGGLAGVP
ncbi:AfsR/SARP family transcriptional regulator [Streptomyces sp. NPDC096040]|uniref:AfsR/SARP family transcriptional regulator n=1 Tax=Streptomyces sp. NPDC096040 TaxID=3155541 RepID=UPI00331CE8AB